MAQDHPLSICAFHRQDSKKSARSRFLALGLGLAVAGVSMPFARAANTTDTFTSATATDWSVPGSWSTGLPTSSNDVLFTTGSAATSTISAENFNIGSFNSTIVETVTNGGATASTLTLGGGSATTDQVAGSNAADLIYVTGNTLLGTTGTALNFVLGQAGQFDAVGGTLTIGLPAGTSTLSLGGFTLTATGTSAMQINSVISDGSASPGSILKTGTNSLVLNTGNTYTGTTTIESGTLNGGSATSFGIATSALALGDATSITGNLSATLQLGGTNTILSRNITVGASNASTTGIYTITSANNSQQTAFAGTETLNQNLVVNATGGAVLNLGGSVTSGTATPRTLTFAQGTVLSTSAIGGGVGTIALTKSVSGTTTLLGANTYTGDTTVSGGTLIIGGASQLGAGSYGGAIADTATLIYNSTANQTFSGAISGAGTLTKNNTGTLTLSGSNTYSTGTGVNAGTLTLDYSTNNNSKIGGVLTLAGGTINLSGGSFAQTVTSTTLGAGESTINQPGGASTLALGTLTRNAGSFLDLGAGGIASTGTGTASTLLTSTAGVVGVVGGNDWAAKNAANTSIVGLSTVASYTNSTATTVSGNADVITNVAGTALSASTLRFNAAAASTVDATGGTLTLTQGGVLVTPAVGNNVTTITGGTVKAGSNNALFISQNNTSNGLTIASVVADGSAASALTKAGAGLLTLSNTTNTYTGKTYLVGGTLNIAADTSLGTAPAAAVVDQLTINGGTLQFGAAISLAANRGITLGGNGATFDTNGNNATIAGIIAGPLYGVTKIGAGTLTLSGVNTYTGSTTVNAGTLTVTANNGLGSNAASGTPVGTLAVNNPNTGAGTAVILNLPTGADTGVGPLTGAIAAPSSGTNTATINTASGRTFTVNEIVAGTYGGVIAGAGNVALGVGSTALTLTGANTYTGTTAINGGVLQLGNGGATGKLAAASVITDNANLTVNRNNAVAQGTDFSSAAISGIGSFTQAGSGTTTFNVSNTYSGATTINAGTLTLTNGNALPNSPTITVNSGGTLALTNADTLLATANAGKDVLFINSGGQVLNNGTAVRDTLGNTVTMTGGTLGGTSAGDANGTYSFNTTAAVTATSDAAGNAAQITASKISLQAGTATFNVTRGTATPAADLIISSVIAPFTGNGSGLTKTGNGIIALTGANTYTGATTISAGVLQLGNGGAAGSLATSSAITNNANLTINRNNAVTQGTDFSSAAISGTGSFTQAGSGTTTFNVANIYSGATAVNAGTLQLGVANAVGGTSGVSVASNSQLSLAAADALKTSVATTSVISGSPLSVSGTIPVSLGGGLLLRNGAGVSLGSQAGTTGTVGLGALTLTAASTLDFGTTGVGTLNFNGLSGLSSTNTLTVTDYTSTYASTTDAGAGKDGTDDRLIFNQNVASFLSYITIDGLTPGEIALGNGEYELTIAPVPEPATWIGGLLMVAILGFAHRRRVGARLGGSCEV